MSGPQASVVRVWQHAAQPSQVQFLVAAEGRAPRRLVVDRRCCAHCRALAEVLVPDAPTEERDRPETDRPETD